MKVSRTVRSGEKVESSVRMLLRPYLSLSLLLPDNGDFDAKALNAMVKEVNATEVALEDILSDKVQFCDGRTAVMENAEKREARLEKEKAAAVEKPAEKTGLHGKLEKAKEEIKSGDVLGKPQGKTRDTAMVM